MKIILVSIVIIIFSLLNIKLNAYCIHNNTDITIKVEQTTGGKGWPYRFSKNLDPGESACCNWKNSDCNTGGHRDSLVGFDVSYLSSGGNNDAGFTYICNDFKIKAGGDLVVKGKNGNYKCIGLGY